jgi:glutamate-1-semialdehyde 2,1-aminomutase
MTDHRALPTSAAPSGGPPERYREHEYAARARAVMPGGNNRTTLHVPPSPPFAVRGEGCRVTDQLGHVVLDCNNNYTSLIHGHAQPDVIRAATAQAPLGTAFGLPTPHEVALAELLAARTGLPQWRFSNSGSEAVMTAVRAARAHTGRDLLVRFEGSYHGTYDAVVAGSAPGVPAAAAAASLALPQGDRAAVDAVMADRGSQVAAVLLDLMPNRAGLVPADPGFVEHLRAVTRRHGALLVVDEVITFRLAEGGLHTRYGIEPDLVTVGKIIGGGFPVGGVGGSAEVMAVFDPDRPGVAWGGTFSGNPISMVAGLEAMRRYDPAAVEALNSLGDRLRDTLAGAGVAVSGSGSLARIREDLPGPALWWDFYLAGLLTGTNGLLALSTPMTPEDVDRVAEIIVTVVRTARSGPS